MPGEDNISNTVPGETKHLIVIPAGRRLRRSKGLTAKAWRRAFDTEGRPTDVAKLLGKVGLKLVSLAIFRFEGHIVDQLGLPYQGRWLGVGVIKEVLGNEVLYPLFHAL